MRYSLLIPQALRLKKRNNLPLYEYECNKCLQNFESRHSYKVTLTACDACGSQGTVSKVISSVNYLKKNKTHGDKKVVGQEVQQAIEEAAVGLKEQQENLHKKRK